MKASNSLPEESWNNNQVNTKSMTNMLAYTDGSANELGVAILSGPKIKR